MDERSKHRAVATADSGVVSAPTTPGLPVEAAPASERAPRNNPLLGALRETGEMMVLAKEVVVSAVREPRGYWGEVREQMFAILKLCIIPLTVSCIAFGLGAPGLQGGNLYSLFGIPERLGSFFIMASIREFAPWIDAMIVAGVVGTAITADLGARRIREEIDALEVLGIDPVRALVIPRVIALTIMTGLLVIFALCCGVIGGFIAAVPILDATPAAFVTNFWSNASTVDLIGSVLKTTIFGFLIGVICCFKGLNAKGGSIGVGRAVNQAVVISFAVIWIFNYVFTTIMLGLYPGIQVAR